MGFTGYLRFSSWERPDDPRELLECALELLGSERYRYVLRVPARRGEWRYMRTIRRLVSMRLRREKVALISGAEHARAGGEKCIAEDGPVSDLHRFLRRGSSLYARLVESSWNDRFHEEFVRVMPDEVRGHFLFPSRPILEIGPHDVVDHTDYDNPRYLGRSYLSISILGLHDPVSWPKAREIMLSMETTREFKERLEEIAGEVTTLMYWC